MFVKGEIIVCVNNTNKVNGKALRGLTVGREYKVVKDQRTKFVFINNNMDEYTSFFADRFEAKAVEAPFAPMELRAGDEVVINYQQEQIDPMTGKIKSPFMNVSVDSPGWVEDMDEFIGKVVTLKLCRSRENGKWKIEDDGGEFVWSAAWFAPVAKPKNAGLKAPAKPAEPVYRVGDEVYVHKAGVAGVKPSWLDLMNATLMQKYKVTEVHAKHLVLDNGYAYQLTSVVHYDAARHKIVERRTIDAAIIEARAKQGGAGGVASYILVYEGKPGKDAVLQTNLRDICHARLSKQYGGVPGESTGNCKAVVDFVGYHYGVKDNGENTKMYKKYVDYIVNRSPWAIAYNTKDIEDIWENGAVLRTDLSGDIVAGACVAARVGHEFGELVLPIFTHLIKENINEHAAWLCAVSFCKTNGGYAIAQMGGGHHVVRADLRTDALLSLFKAGFKKSLIETTRPYEVSQRYRITEPMQETPVCVKAPLVSWSTFIHQECEVEVKGEGWNKEEKVTLKSIEKFAKKLEQLIKE